MQEGIEVQRCVREADTLLLKEGSVLAQKFFGKSDVSLMFQCLPVNTESHT